MGRPSRDINGNRAGNTRRTPGGHSYMDPDLYKAAEGGQIEPFITKVNSTKTNLSLLVTPANNTILHIYLMSSNSATEKSRSFIDAVLNMSPSLLLQANDDGDTPLHLAARFGHSEVVRALVERACEEEEDVERGSGGAREMLQMVNKYEDAAMHEAVRGNHLQVVKELIRECPDVAYQANGDEETPLYIAAVRGYPRLVDEILESCTVVMSTSAAACGPHGRTALHAALMRHDYDFEKPITDRKTFMVEAETNRWKWIDKTESIRYRLSNTSAMVDKMLEKRECLVREADEFGWTPLHYAVYYNPHESVSTVTTLLSHDKSIAYQGEASKNTTALHLAACLGYVSMMREMISRCPDCCELVDDRGWNFVHYAVVGKSYEALRFCLDDSAFANLVNGRDDRGNTPMHLLAASTPELPHLVHHRKWVDLDALNREKVRCMDISRNVFPKVKEEILEAMEDLPIGPGGKLVVTRKGYWERKDVRQIFNRAKDSHLVVSALIATVTFAAAFTLPGGTDIGSATLNHSSPFKAFVATDAIALVFSISAVLIQFAAAAIAIDDRQKWLFHAEIWFTITAMGAMVIAFITGLYAVLIPSSPIAVSVCVIGSTFFLFLLYMIAVKLRAATSKKPHSSKQAARARSDATDAGFLS